jgi:hypothetical protein
VFILSNAFAFSTPVEVESDKTLVISSQPSCNSTMSFFWSSYTTAAFLAWMVFSYKSLLSSDTDPPYFSNASAAS